MPAAALDLIDELPFAFGWTEPGWMGRSAHALRTTDGKVFLLDPFDAPGLDERVLALGRPAAVVQLLDRHERDGRAIARRLEVPHLRLPQTGPHAELEVVPVLRAPGWHEVALLHRPTRTLVCADALAGSEGYRAPGEVVGVHPFLRLRPPRALARQSVEHLLLGHGPGVHGSEAQSAIEQAMATARTRLPAFAVGALRRAIRV